MRRRAPRRAVGFVFPRTVWLRLRAIVLVVTVTAAACQGDGSDGSARPASPAQPQDGGTVVFALDQEPDGWNPNKPSDYALDALTQHVLPRPFRVRPDFEVVLDTDLLVSAEQTDDDPQTIRYVIRDDAQWSDGTPISGDDFRYVWRQIVDPANDVASTAGYEEIDDVRVSDDGKTVEVVFSRRFGDWRSLFSHLLPAHIMRELDGGWDGLDGTNVPTFSGGPFVLKDYQPERSVRLERNPDYWGKNAAVLDEIVVRFGIDAADLPAALENDEVDLASAQAQPALVEEVAGLAPNVVQRITTGLTFEHLDFNLEHPLLQHVAVRRAIAYALDEKALVEGTVGVVTEDAGPLRNRIFAVGQPAYEAHGADYRGADVDKAKTLLEDAGFELGRDQVYARDGTRLSFRLATTGGNSLRETAQSLIRVQLRAAGIEVQPDNDEGTEVFERIFPPDPAARDFDAVLFSWVRPPFPSGNGPLYTTGSLANEMRYSDPEVDELFDRARRELDADAAADIYNRIDQILWRDVPTIPLYATPSLLVHRRTIVNVTDNVSSAGPLWNAYEWALAE